MLATKIGSAIVMAVGLLFHLIGSILLGVIENLSTFDIRPLANSFRDLGLLAALLAGLVLIATIIVGIVKNAFEKKQ